MGLWVGVSDRGNWWSTAEPTISEGAPFRINKYVPTTSFEGILFHYIIQIEGMLNIMMCSST